MSQDVLQLARQGDARSIAYLINQALEPRGIRVRALREQHCLHVLLEAEQVPPQKLSRFVRGGIVCLGAASIHVLRVYGRQAGTALPAWTQEWTLRSTAPSSQFLAAPVIRSTAIEPPLASGSRPDLSQPPPFASSLQQPVVQRSVPKRSVNQRSIAKRSPSHQAAHLVAVSTAASQTAQTQQAGRQSAKQSAKQSAAARRYSVSRLPWTQTRRKLGVLVPLAFATGVVVAVGWHRMIVDLPESDRANREKTSANPGSVNLGANRSSQTSTIALTPPVASSAAPQAQIAELPITELPTDRTVAANPSSTQPALTIKAVGDIILGTNFPNNRLPDQDGAWLFDQVKPFFDGADILFGNFESTLTDYPYAAKDTSQGQTFAFRTPPAYANLLQQVGFDVLSVANNHSFDFGDQGFADTIAHIQQTGMQAVGQRNQIVYTTVNGGKVAFIGFSYFPDHNSILDLDAGRALVEEAKQQANIVVISVHAGAEGTDARHTRNETEYFFGENRGNLVEFSRAMIDQGADLILGHGPHIPRAMELYKSRLIAYSLGNFVGYRTLSTDGALGYSLILDAQLSDQGEFLTGRVIPVRLDNQGVPFIDDDFKSVSFVRNLIESDFPVTPLLIDESGQILRNEAPLPAS